MRELGERAYFTLCRALGRLLRSGRYTKVRVNPRGSEPLVRKRRVFCAPLFIWAGRVLVGILDAGIRVLPQREWAERERRMNETLRGMTARIESDGTVVLPYLPGTALALLLDDPRREAPARLRAIELAVTALVALHTRGCTHGDAMAENVIVDLAAGIAHWIDFETVHDSNRSMAWRRADDLRALLTTCLLRTAPEQRAATLTRILDRYPDRTVARLLPGVFRPVIRRPLTLHLGQAPLTFDGFREIGRMLDESVTP